MSKIILSGMQPTNQLQLGNYLGALRNWVKLQDESFDTLLYTIVDLHAITMPYDASALANSTREVAAAYLAAGIDPSKSSVFVQSAVMEHAELNWLLATMTQMGKLSRMTQFKDKAGKDKEKAGLGLYAYPVLMAADILVYRATHVPVGEDQKQHLELARDIAATFNHRYNQEFFPMPEPQILGEATRVMSLRDGTSKMSKSDPSDLSRINLTDDADTIAKKIRKAKTDPEALPDNLEDLEKRPEANNLVTIYAALSDQSRAEILNQFAGKQFSDFKPALADVAVAHLSPITDKMNRLLDDPAEIDRILSKGNETARGIAGETMKQVKEIMGFWSA